MTEHATPVDTGKQHGPVTGEDHKKEAKKEREETAKQIKDISDKMAAEFKKYGNMFDNIPLSSSFWTLRNQLASLTEIQKYQNEEMLAEIKAAHDKKMADCEAKVKEEMAKEAAAEAKETSAAVAHQHEASAPTKK